MSTKNEVGSPQQERLRNAENAAESGSKTPSLRAYKEKRDELVNLTKAAKEHLEKRDEVLGAPSAKFSRTVVDRYNSELKEMAGKIKGLLDRMHEYRFMPPSKRWTDKYQAELEKTIEKSTSVLNKIEIPITQERQAGITRSIETRLRADMAEAMEETKEKRVELTRRIKRAKASFAGKYKVSYDRALILSKAPTGWLGRLADRLAGNTPLTSKEVELAKRLKTQEAQDDLKNMAALFEKADELWAKIHRTEKGSIIAPDELASIDTLRAVVKESYPNASEEEREKKADAAVKEIQHLNEYENAVATAEMIGESLEEKERQALVPSQPETVEEMFAKKKAEEQKILSDMVDRLKNVETPEQKIINQCIDNFGGGAKGREAAAKLWDEIQNKINLGKNMVDFTALDYVQLAGRLRVAASDKNSEDYEKLSKRLEQMNKALGYPEFMNPATGAGMQSPDLTRSKALGGNISRAEIEQRAETITGMDTRTIASAERARTKNKEPMGQPLSIEWASTLLTSEVAGQEWNEAVKLMHGNRKSQKEKNKQIELSAFMIRDKFSEMQNKLANLKDLSDSFAALAKYRDTPKGNPPEATLMVMLKAFDKIIPLTEDDKKAQNEIRLTLGEIYRALTYFNQPLGPTPKRPSMGKEYEGSEKLNQAIEQATAEALDKNFEPLMLKKEQKNEERAFDIKSSLGKELIDKLANEAAKILPKDKKIPKDFLKNYKTALKKFFSAANDSELISAQALIRGLNRKYFGQNGKIEQFQDMLADMRKSLIEQST